MPLQVGESQSISQLSTSSLVVLQPAPVRAKAAALEVQAAGAGLPASPVVYLLPATTPPPTVDLWARLFAGLGLCVGLLGFGFGVWKMMSDRRLSILDDFWLRKIIAPAAIEPLIETIADLLEELPPAGSKVRQQKAFAKKMTEEIQRVSGGMQTLAMIDADLPTQMLVELSKCEDLFADYLQALANRETPDMGELHAKMWLSISSAFEPIQAWQSRALFKFRRKLKK